jgi:hypothetical protein
VNRPTPNPSERIRHSERETRNNYGNGTPGLSPKTARNLAFFSAAGIGGENLYWTLLERAKGFEPSTPTLERLCSSAAASNQREAFPDGT